MLSSPDEISQTTEALQELSRTPHRRSALHGRKHSVQTYKHTDDLPELTSAPRNIALAWRQATQLREENRRLQNELAEQSAELKRLISEYDAAQAEFENELSVTRDGQLQEIVHYQEQLQQATEEREQLQSAQEDLERRYQELYHQFQDAVEEEAHKMVTEAANTMELSPGSTPSLLQNVMRTLEMQARKGEDKRLVEVLYLKREILRVFEQLAQERQLANEELQHLLVIQNTAREQAELRQKTLKARLYAQWRMRTVTTTIGGLFLLVVLQFVCLKLFNIPLEANLSLSLIAPIVVCIALCIVLRNPVDHVKQVYTGAPHRKKEK